MGRDRGFVECRIISIEDTIITLSQAGCFLCTQWSARRDKISRDGFNNLLKKGFNNI